MGSRREKTIGSKIRELREAAGLTQIELAAVLNLSRPSMIAIENDSREIKFKEVQIIAQHFQISLTDLIEDTGSTEVILEKRKSQGPKKKSKPVMRISVPQKKLGKFKEVLLYILGQVGAKPNVGETVLYKLLYFIDFDFYEKYEEQLIGATYIKNQYGPTPVEFARIVQDMVANSDLEIVKSQYFKKPQRKYLPRRRADLSQLSAREIDVINSVLQRLSDKNASALSEYSHRDVPWVIAQDKEPIDYESVFYRTPEFSVRKEDADEFVDL